MSVILCLLGATPPTLAQEQSSVVFDDTPGLGGAGDAPSFEANGGTHFSVDYCPSCVESHGVLVGSGLFQSLFKLRLVESTDSVTFSATFPDPMPAPQIDNLLIRVTGDDGALVNGLLSSTIPGADVFVLSPNGVIFGQDSTLETKGSFYATTAHELRFSTNTLSAAEGPRFEAWAGGAIPTIDANPAEFGFLQEFGPPAAIEVAGNRLSVPAGETLSFIGGEVDVKGLIGSSRPLIETVDGIVVELVAVSAGTNVSLDDVRGLDAGDDPDALVRFSQNARIEIDGVGSDPGRIVIRGGRFVATRGPGDLFSAQLRVTSAGEGSDSIDIAVGGDLSAAAATFESVMSVGGTSGDIAISGANVTLTDNTTIRGRIGLFALDPLPGPSIAITADTLRLEDASSIRTEDDLGSGFALGKVGDITISANKVELTGTDSGIFTLSQGTGAGGIIKVTAFELDLGDRAQITSNRIRPIISNNTAVPGAIIIAADRIRVADAAQISSQTSNFLSSSLLIGNSDGSSVTIGSPTAPVSELEITGGAIGSVTHSEGTGGAVTVYARNIVMQRSEAQPESTPQITAVTAPEPTAEGEPVQPIAGGTGTGGELRVFADSMELRDGSQLGTGTFGGGTGGDVTVIVAGMLLASGVSPSVGPGGEVSASGIFARSETNAGEGEVPTETGQGGDLTIEAGLLIVEGGAEISARTLTAGSAGDLTITTGDLIVRGSSADTVSAISTRGAAGDGGELDINADRIQLRDGGLISASANGVGDSGDLTIVANEIDVSGDGSGIFAQSRSGVTNAGTAGSISISAPDGGRTVVRVTDGGTISVAATQSAAGTLSIESAELVRIANGGSITAEVGSVPGQDLAPSNIEILDATRIELDNGSISARTVGSGSGGSITLVGDQISLSNGSTISAESTAIASGDAGDIVIAAGNTFEASSSAITTTAQNGGGGRISIQADRLVSIFDTTIETSVLGQNAASDAGDINIPLAAVDPGSGTAARSFGPTAETAPQRVVPRFVVINQSSIIADATVADAGNITIAGQDVLISADSVLRAHSDKGVSGDIQVTSPDADIVSQVTALPSSFVDPSDRLLPPCVARTERTGSFIVQKRKAVLRSPDAPLSPNSQQPLEQPRLDPRNLEKPGAASGSGERVLQFGGPARCFVPEESS